MTKVMKGEGLMDMSQNVSELLFQLGIYPSYKGFVYAVCAVSLSLERRESLTLVTKWLYPDIAKKFGTNWRAVERNLRTVSRLAWLRNRTLLEAAAKHSLPRQPRNTEFISILCFAVQESML